MLWIPLTVAVSWNGYVSFESNYRDNNFHDDNGAKMNSNSRSFRTCLVFNIAYNVLQLGGTRLFCHHEQSSFQFYWQNNSRRHFNSKTVREFAGDDRNWSYNDMTIVVFRVSTESFTNNLSITTMTKKFASPLSIERVAIDITF